MRIGGADIKLIIWLIYKDNIISGIFKIRNRLGCQAPNDILTEFYWGIAEFWKRCKGRDSSRLKTYKDIETETSQD